MTGLRVTWVQPEDLIGHELRQASQDGRDAARYARRWQEAGGRPAPDLAGASPTPGSPRLRALAAELLDELALLPSPLSADEPTELSAVRAACEAWPGAGDTARQGGGTVMAMTADRAERRELATGPARANGPTPPPHQRMPHPVAPDHAPYEAPVPRRPGSCPPASRFHAAWLGRAVGCLLGKPVEKLPLAGIRALGRATGNWPPRTWFTARGLPHDLAARYPWNRRSAPVSLAENIDGMPEDDDLDYPLLNLLLLQRHGRDFTTGDVARLWLDAVPAGRVFTAERVAYRNLLCGVEPPDTARHHNPFREWIGAAIRADVHGWTCPGEPGAAAAQAYRDAVLTHTANGVYSAMFLAATIAEAAGSGRGDTDVHRCLRAGLTVVPPRSRLARAVRLGISAARGHTDFDTVVDRLHHALGHYHWVHAVPNAALLAAALTHADGDFTGSISRAVSGGWDTDSNGASAGSIAGLLAGHPDRIPERWTAPLRNRLATSVAGFDGVGFDTLADLTREEALRP